MSFYRKIYIKFFEKVQYVEAYLNKKSCSGLKTTIIFKGIPYRIKVNLRSTEDFFFSSIATYLEPKKSIFDKLLFLNHFPHSRMAILKK
jgi:hypothetical protein